MAIAYATGAPVMMQLGGFQFCINTAAYQGASRSDEWRWPGQERFGQAEALQHVGPGATSMSLDGVIYPEWKGGLGQLDAMRAEAGAGKPLVLVNGRGQALGMWVIERIDENQSVFAAGGVARRIEFTLQLKRFSADVTGPVPQLPPLPQPRPPIPPEAATAVQQARGLADTAIEGARPLMEKAAGAWRSLQAELSPATERLRQAAGAAQRLAETAQQMQSASQRVLVELGRASESSAGRLARSFGLNAERLRLRADSAGRILQRVLGHIEGAPEEAARAVIDALGCARTLETLCRTVAHEAGRIAAMEVRP